MGDTVNLNIKRSNEQGDSRLASVTDRLEEALEDSKTRDWTKCVMLFYSEKDGKYFVVSRYAGCTGLEARGMLLTEISEELLG